MYDLSGKFFWDADPNEKIIILTRNHDSNTTDAFANRLPDEFHVQPEDLISFELTDLVHAGRNVAATAGTAAIGTALLGPVGLLMGLTAGAMTSNKENKKTKKADFQFRFNGDDYEYHGSIPTGQLYLLDGIIDNPNFGKNITMGNTQNRLSDSVSKINNNVSTIDIKINPSDPEPTMNRIKLFLEDGKWDEALQYCKAALDLFPTNSKFYMLSYCAENKLESIELLLNQPQDKLTSNESFNKALRFSTDDPDDAKAIFEQLQKNAYEKVLSVAKISNTSSAYSKLSASMGKIKGYGPAIEKQKEYEALSSNLFYVEINDSYELTKDKIRLADDPDVIIEGIKQYEGQIEKIVKNGKLTMPNGEHRNRLVEEIQKSREEAYEKIYGIACGYFDDNKDESLNKADDLFKYLGSYKDSYEKRQFIREHFENKKSESLYQQAIEAEDAKDYEGAIRLFTSLGDFKDSSDKLEFNQTKLDEIRKAEKEVSDNRKKHTKKIIFIVGSAVAACIIVVVLLTTVIIPSNKYNNAIEMKEAGQYKEAIKSFKALGDYKDSEKQVSVCKQLMMDEMYLEALELKNSGNYTKAIKLFNDLGDYKTSLNQIIDCRYLQCLEFIGKGEIIKAYEGLLETDLANYKDSKEKRESIYKQYCIEKIKIANVGDYVDFGLYEQDNKKSNGKESISWEVLDKENGELLLMSSYVLDLKPYNTDGSAASWENCSLRKWLNNDFYNNAFSKDDQKRILTNKVYSGSKSVGNSTTDKVFLLSEDELEEYCSTDASRNTYYTEYCRAYHEKEYDTYTSENDASYWLRPYKDNYSDVDVVGPTGGIVGGFMGNDHKDGIRPVIRIKTK